MFLTPVSLRYPNGRIYDTTLNRELQLGDEFELYGRTWTAVRAKQERWPRGGDGRIVCVPSELAGLTDS